MKRNYTFNDSLRTRPIHHFSTQDMRNSLSVSRREHLCGWEISQLVLLHDDLGIVEWFNDAERQIFPGANKEEWCRSFFGRVTSRTSENRLQPAQNDIPALNTFSTRLHEICLKRNTLNNPEMMPSMTELRKADRDIEEIRQHFVSCKPGHKAKADMHDPHRAIEGRERRFDGYSKPLLNPISKICNLERRLAAKRKAKIDKGMESLRQPLTTTTRWSKRELFNPSVISVASDSGIERPREDSQETRKTLYKKYLQLLPIDRAFKLRTRANTINLPPPNKNLAPLPKNPYSKQLQYKTVNSRVFNEKAVHSILKPDFLVQQTKETFAVREGLCGLHREIEPQQQIAVKTDIVGSRPCSTEAVTKNPF
ncbi:hypothetical protein ACROYT_G043321 [Oculina patagonica]